ncbi:ABC-2 type transport system permease protein [Granulicella aggregans]|uniref:ABC-2 type transport system permease protein n=1 Tax=Granulicella aggregans TaxID=474949 RepID=A0A7W7ZBI3_9BACT|nr:ABC transporter permease [Granulicella aggregans]MBB5056728.1 ABC-2 type transport system permease protein [Granulicella aggregans]
MSSVQPSFFHNTWLIAKREYVERIRAKSFIVMTVLIPALMGGLTFAMNYATGKNAKSDVNLAIVTQDSRFGLDLQQELAKHKHPKITANVLSPQGGGADTRLTLEGELKSKDLDGYLWVTPPVSEHAAPTFEWKTRARGYINTQNELSESIRTVLTRQGLAHTGMGANDVEALMQPIDLDASVASKDSASSGEAVAFGLFFIMYFVILFYGMNVARSIIEEKTSRIFEVLLATIRPEEMMAGKVLGVGSVGLTQVGIWLLGAIALSAPGLISLGDDFAFHITARQGIFFVVFFFLGYTLYSGMAAALGAMTSSEQELQQMNIFLMLPLIACSGVVFTVVSDPSGTVAKVFSFIPFCTPLIMYVRIAVSQPPWYEIAISIAGLVLTIAAILWFAARIYRVGILMYGKKPNLPELLRWLKYS